MGKETDGPRLTEGELKANLDDNALKRGCPMLDKDTPVQDLQAMLMELVLPDGSHPLRMECPGLKPFSCIKGQLADKKGCVVCHANDGRRGYIFNPDIDVLGDALKAKDWAVRRFTNPYWRGDSIGIYQWEGDEQHVYGHWKPCLGFVEPEDEVWGTHAIRLAVCRALELTPCTR